MLGLSMREPWGQGVLLALWATTMGGCCAVAPFPIIRCLQNGIVSLAVLMRCRMKMCFAVDHNFDLQFGRKKQATQLVGFSASQKITTSCETGVAARFVWWTIQKSTPLTTPKSTFGKQALKANTDIPTVFCMNNWGFL